MSQKYVLVCGMCVEVYYILFKKSKVILKKRAHYDQP